MSKSSALKCDPVKYLAQYRRPTKTVQKIIIKLAVAIIVAPVSSLRYSGLLPTIEVFILHLTIINKERNDYQSQGSQSRLKRKKKKENERRERRNDRE
jgi:hypothetical protein